MKVKPYSQLNNQHSLSGVILTEYCYKHIYKQGPYVVPPEVSVYDVTIGAKAEKTVVNRAEMTHEPKLSDRALYNVANTGCVNFIMSVVDETWYKELEDVDMFYTNVTAQQLLEQLEDHCTGLHSITSRWPSRRLHTASSQRPTSQRTNTSSTSGR